MKISVGKPGAMTLLGKCWLQWKYNTIIERVLRREIEDIEWTQQAQNIYQWRAVLNTAISQVFHNHWVSGFCPLSE
jgi:hypothetical protein